MEAFGSIKKIINVCRILSGNEVLFLLILTLISTVAETFSIGLIVPIFSNQVKIINYLSSYGIDANINYLVGFVVLVFAVKSWFVWYVMNIQNNYSFKIQYLASMKIFSLLGKKDYESVIAKGKDYYSTMFNVDLIHFRDTLLLVILLITESAVVLGLLIVAVYIAPSYTINASIVLFSAALIFRYTFARISSRYGSRRIESDRDKNSWIRGFFGAFEEVKVMNLDNFFANKFSISAQESSLVGAKQITLNQSPRFIFELLIVLMIGVIVTLSIVESGSSDENGLKTTLLPLITLGAVAFRILPSMNRISGALQGISFGAPATETVSRELEEYKEKDTPKPSIGYDTTKIISFEVRDINLSIRNNLIITGGNAFFKIGGMHGLIGESGAGKSSFIRAILGLYSGHKGKILINDHEAELSNYIAHGRVAIVPQQSFIVDGTVLDNILVGREYSENLIKSLSVILDWVETLPNGMLTRIGETGLQISGGQAQRLNIARALYKKPEIIIMDESTSALDGETQKNIVKILSDYSCGNLVIMITHRKEVLNECISVHEIRGGMVVKCK